MGLSTCLLGLLQVAQGRNQDGCRAGTSWSNSCKNSNASNMFCKPKEIFVARVKQIKNLEAEPDESGAALVPCGSFPSECRPYSVQGSGHGKFEIQSLKFFTNVLANNLLRCCCAHLCFGHYFFHKYIYIHIFVLDIILIIDNTYIYIYTYICMCIYMYI